MSAKTLAQGPCPCAQLAEVDARARDYAAAFRADHFASVVMPASWQRAAPADQKGVYAAYTGGTLHDGARTLVRVGAA